MASFNLFANIDAFASNNGNNDSFGELDVSCGDVVEMDEVDCVELKPVTKSRSRKNKSKAKVTPEDVSYLSEKSDDEVAVSPGVGQKTAFKKLSQIKKSLASTAVTEPVRRRNRLAMNRAIEEAYERKQSRRSGATETSQLQFARTSAFLQSNTVHNSFGEEELSVNIKIKWEGTLKIEKIHFSMYKTFEELINELSAREKVDAKSFLLMFGNKVIKQDDSPHSIGYTLGKFISIRVVENADSFVGELTSTSSSQSNTIEVKIQSPLWKKPMICNIKLTDQFKVLIAICSEKLKCHPNTLRFKFDGEIIDNTSTPDDLDFEAGEILDLIMSE